ncbi:MAG: DUF2236 domain-containing protein [Chloroflexota bacterium]|nr:DUF2236 domain-containing protein [Chloroflexota bacterium]
MGVTDQGLFGPGSLSWRIDREVVVLGGGSCALLMQIAHPAVAAGVAQHSTFREEPFGRLRRTLSTSFDLIFGTPQQAQRSIERVNAIHRSVRGTIPETGEPYSALEPRALLWVHATLVDTALRVYDRFVAPLSPEEAETYYGECRAVALAFGVPEELVPDTLPALREWMSEAVATGEVKVTPTARSLAPSVLYPTRFPPRFVWDLAHLASISTLPAELRRQFGLPWSPARERAVDRSAAVSRRLLPFVPRPLRFVPHARSADRRVGV